MRDNASHTKSVVLFSTLLVVAVFGLNVLHPKHSESRQQDFQASAILDNAPNGLIDENVPLDVDQILELRELVDRPLTGSFLDGDDTSKEFAFALEQVSGQSMVSQSDALRPIVADVPKLDLVSADALAEQSASLLEQAAVQAQSTDPQYAESLRHLARKIRKKTKEITSAN